MDDEAYNSPAIQAEMLQRQAQMCNNGSRLETGWCPETWDGILCWPSTATNETAVQSCPHYIAGFDFQANASKSCMPDGRWFRSYETNVTWSNYTNCYTGQLVTILMNLPDIDSDNVTLIKKYLPAIKTIAKVGYAFSLFSLLVAFCIFATIKKLRCPRNMLHMHLFASFMTRAFVALLKNALFVGGVGLSSDVIVKDGESYWLGGDLESNWRCKAFLSLWQYCILANYSWLLMEGLYLHNLIFCALFVDANSSIVVYAALGWGLPAAFVIPWIILRAMFEDIFCWTTNNNSFVFLLIRAPIIMSVVVNFILFINIIRVLVSKLKSTVSEETQRYKKLARSTLVLVPLFGVHYMFFLGMSYSMGVNETIELIWLFCDQLFASFQGLFVAFLYCFLNGEVRSEVSKIISRHGDKHPRFGEFLGSRKSRTSIGANSCNGPIRSDGSRKPSNFWRSTNCFRSSRHKNYHRRSTQSMGSTQEIGTCATSLMSSRDHIEKITSGSIKRHSQSTASYDRNSDLAFCTTASIKEGRQTVVVTVNRVQDFNDQHQCCETDCRNSYELRNLAHNS